MFKTWIKTYDGASAGPVFFVHATALKSLHKAGRRGGDSIAREGCKHVCGGCASGMEAHAMA